MKWDDIRRKKKKTVRENRRVNQETLATLSTQHTGRRLTKQNKNKQRRLKKMSNMDSTKHPKMTPGARER